MGRTLFYLGAIFVVLNIFNAITASNITLGFVSILVAIGLFLQLLTYNCFKQYREEIKNIYLSTLQWFKK
jgi:hypothetical protein